MLDIGDGDAKLNDDEGLPTKPTWKMGVDGSL
jgi:hypothetical protein